MADANGMPRIEVDRAAAAFIRRRGGEVFVWLDSGGFKHVKLRHPSHANPQFRRIEADGFVFYEDSNVLSPPYWRVVLKWFPWPRVDALWNGGSGPGPAETGAVWPT